MRLVIDNWRSGEHVGVFSVVDGKVIISPESPPGFADHIGQPSGRRGLVRWESGPKNWLVGMWEQMNSCGDLKAALFADDGAPILAPEAFKILLATQDFTTPR